MAWTSSWSESCGPGASEPSLVARPMRGPGEPASCRELRRLDGPRRNEGLIWVQMEGFVERCAPQRQTTEGQLTL